MKDKLVQKSLVPLKGRIIVIEDDPIKEVGGIILPEGKKEFFKKGVIHMIPTDSELNVGDRILYRGEMSTELEVDGTKYRIMKESDVWAVETI
jgi:chaperonin GroES